MTTVSVVILNYNGKEYLRQFLPPVIRFSGNARIIVVDNASEDDSVQFLKDHFPEIEQVTLEKNLGYAGGYNQALKMIESDYYVLLNSDIEVTENWLSPIIAQLEKNPDVAAAQPKILSYKDKKLFEYAGASGGFIDFLGYPFCRGRIFDRTESDLGQYDKMRPVFWASGACFIVRSGAFHQLGAFDETFFAHMEEIDLCWRINNQGYKVLAYPQCVIYHVGAGTLPVTSPRKTYLNFNNNLAMLTKNLPLTRLMIILPLRWALDWVALIRFLIQGQGKHGWAVIKAHFNFYLNFPSIWKKRCSKIGMADPGLVYRGSIVFDYFIRGKKRFEDLGFE